MTEVAKSEQSLESRLDEAFEMTFPASDPSGSISRPSPERSTASSTASSGASPLSRTVSARPHPGVYRSSIHKTARYYYVAFRSAYFVRALLVFVALTPSLRNCRCGETS